MLSDVFVSNADRLKIDVDVVTKVFQHVCSRKATGPDGISVQLVKVNQTLSQTVVTNTHAPQGCVSSPILYILYTNDCTSSSTNNYIIKFSDDSAILSLLHAYSDISMYTSEIESFVHWCDNNHLKLNVSKMQKMIFDAKCIVADHLPVVVHGEEIAQIGQHKYPSVHLDNKLSWNVHVHSVCSKVHQLLYFP